MPGKQKIFLKAVIYWIPIVLVISIILFATAGTLRYWNAWLFIILMNISLITMGVYVFVKNPELLQKRMLPREQERKQSIIVIGLDSSAFISLFIAGFDFRGSWSYVPVALVAVASLVLVAGVIMFINVLKENSFAAKTIEIQNGQKVIDTGIYSHIRHPLYSAYIIIFLSIPIILGSFFALLPMLVLPVLIHFRIKNEEIMLEKGLAGYLEYKQRVKYKLIPFIW